jgi:ribonuclease-3
VAASGPDHDKRFVSAVSINGARIAQGEGKSKQEAEVAAAEKALEVKGWYIA